MQVGDGTTTVVILAGELLRECKAFVEEGVHPQARRGAPPGPPGRARAGAGSSVGRRAGGPDERPAAMPCSREAGTSFVQRMVTRGPGRGSSSHRPRQRACGSSQAFTPHAATTPLRCRPLAPGPHGACC